MLRAIHNPKMCIHMRCYHLVLIFQYYLATMWYVMLMRNSNSTMSINFSSWILFASCMDPIFQLVLFSVVNDIWRVMIPSVCILYSNANIKIMHESWGRFPLLFRTLFYQSIYDISIGI